MFPYVSVKIGVVLPTKPVPLDRYYRRLRIALPTVTVPSADQ